MENLIGYIRKDESSHYYVIPEHKIMEFDKLVRKIEGFKPYSDKWYEYIEKFNDRYSEFRLEGGISNLKVIIDDQFRI